MKELDIRDYIRNNLTLKVKSRQDAYGQPDHIEINLVLEDDSISTIYLEIPKGDT